MKLLTGIALAAAMQLTSLPSWAAENQLSDVRVRQAIAYAIDMDTIVETLFEALARRSTSASRVSAQAPLLWSAQR